MNRAFSALFALSALGAAACNRGPNDTSIGLDTGWFSAIGEDGRCIDQITATSPVSPPSAADGAWYYRRGPELSVATRQANAYRMRVVDAEGVEAPLTYRLVEEGEEKGRILSTLNAPLRANADYVLEATDCDGTEAIPFRTSTFGLPLEVGLGGLNARTFVFDMSRARWIEPTNFGVVISLYFTTPVLIGVQYAGTAGLDLVGGMGIRASDGGFRQANTPTWDFPLADFSESPWFEAQTSVVTVSAEGSNIDIHDFRLAGTFSPDGTRLGGVEISGLGDTRLMGELVGKKGDEQAICSLAATWGVVCEPCPDGRSTCLRLSAVEAYGELVPGLQMRPILP